MHPFPTSISDNIADVRARIARAAERAGRTSEEITLMAVTKTHGPDVICQAYEAGLRVFGENRVQEFAEKTAKLSDLVGVEWHMIGHLQTNKAAKAAELFAGVDSVDSVKLAEKLNGAASQGGKKLSVLIEINVGGEAAKTGLTSGSAELETLLAATLKLEALDFRGLMTIPPYAEDPQRARPYFQRLRELGENIASRQIPAIRMEVLSMGMSHDFEVAIEEGSTCVRVGTAIFGERSRV
jgi:pyridoxal phosphate enzyme (YggS family)